jgi:uncharacterized membrane protein
MRHDNRSTSLLDKWGDRILFLFFATFIITFLGEFLKQIAGNFKVEEQADYIALNLTIIEALLAIVSLLVAGVTFVGFFTIKNQVQNQVTNHLREIDLGKELNEGIKQLVEEALEEKKKIKAETSGKKEAVDPPKLDHKGEEHHGNSR